MEATEWRSELLANLTRALRQRAENELEARRGDCLGEFLPLEVGSVIRGLLLAGEIDEANAGQAIADVAAER